MKKVVAVMLLACMLMSMGAVSAYAADNVVIPPPENGVQQTAAKDTKTSDDPTNETGGTDAKEEGPETPFTVTDGTALFVAGVDDTSSINDITIVKGEKKTVTVVYNPKENVNVVISADNNNISVGKTNVAADTGDYGIATAEITGKSTGTVNLSCTVSSIEEKAEAEETEVSNDAASATVKASASIKVTVNNGITLVDDNKKSEGEMDSDKTLELKATLDPAIAGEKITFKSGNEAAATVDENGVVTGAAAGETTITASAVVNEVTISAEYKLTVIDPAPTTAPTPTPTTELTEPDTPDPTDSGTDPDTPPVIEIKLGNDENGEALTELSMKPGESMTLKVTGADSANYNHEWSSSNDKAATVKDGVVTAVAAGTATITVKVTPAASGKTARAAGEAITASIELTVEAAGISVTGIEIKYNNAEPPACIDVKPNGSIKLEAVVTPEGATEKVVWSSDKESVAKVDETGKVTALSAGKATIKATAGGKEDTCKVQVIGELKIETDKNVIYVGDKVNESDKTAQLSAKVGNTAVDANKVTWTITGGTGIASVDTNGKVTATGSNAGDVVIEGSYTDDANDAIYKGSITIKVVKAGDRFIVVETKNNPITVSGGMAQIIAKVCKYDTSGAVETNERVSFKAEPLGNTCKTGYSISPLASNPNEAWLRCSYNGKFKVTATTVDGLTGSAEVTVNFAPGIVYGNNAVYDGKNMLSFILNDSINNFNGNLWVDGMLLTRDYHYRAQAVYAGVDDRIQVDLNPAFLNYINKAAYHRIDIGTSNLDGNPNGNGQIVSGYFRTWGTTSGINGVKTGDDSNLALWVLLCLGSAGCATAALISYKKRKQK